MVTTVTKFVNQHTKWKEIYFIKEKPQSVDSSSCSTKKVVLIPAELRLVRLQAGKGAKFTSDVVRNYHCLDTSIKVEFAFPNPPQQIGTNERAGRTPTGIVRCLPADSSVLEFLREELMQAAAYT